MSSILQYNLPGHGFSTCVVFDYSKQVYDLFDRHGIIEKTKNITQLGTMKYVYPGAHHTRYEYMFTQMMLISNIVTNKNSADRNIELSLGSCLKEFEPAYSISGGDVMQCLAILSNAGFMYDTFTADRILMQLLQESLNSDKVFYHMYRRNLPKTLHECFDTLVTSNNHYKLHLFHLIHLLNGMNTKENDRPLCDLCIQLLSRLINPALITNEATKKIFSLYKKIRKIAYLSIDMIYTPAAVGINLSRMIYTLPTYIDDLFDTDSPLNQTIRELEEIIHRQIYDSSKSILNSARIEQSCISYYREAITLCKNIYDFRKILLEQKSEYFSLHSQKPSDVSKELLPHSDIVFTLPDLCTPAQLSTMHNLILQSIPKSRIAFGFQISQNLAYTYAAFGLLSEHQYIKDVQTILNLSISNNLYSEHNKPLMIKYALRSVFVHGAFNFLLTAPQSFTTSDCIFIGKGSHKIANEIRKRFNSTTLPNPDELHEVLSVAAVLEQTNYHGLIMCFVGSVKANSIRRTERIDELDGFIYFPAKSNQAIAIIIEAKRYAGGRAGTAARRQLSDTQRFISSLLSPNVVQLPKCAYMELTPINP